MKKKTSSVLIQSFYIYIISLIIAEQEVLISQMMLMRWVCFKVSQHHSNSFEKVFFPHFSRLHSWFCFLFIKTLRLAVNPDGSWHRWIIMLRRHKWMSNARFSFDVNALCINVSGVESRFTSAFSVIVCLALCLCTEGYSKNNCAVLMKRADLSEHSLFRISFWMKTVNWNLLNMRESFFVYLARHSP